MEISLLLEMVADAVGDRRAVGDQTYVQLWDEATRVAGGLRAHGASRLVLAAENSDAIPALLFGAAFAGATFTALNHRLADDRLRAALERCAPAALVADERTASRIAGVDGVRELTYGEPVTAEPGTGTASRSRC